MEMPLSLLDMQRFWDQSASQILLWTQVNVSPAFVDRLLGPVG